MDIIKAINILLNNVPVKDGDFTFRYDGDEFHGLFYKGENIAYRRVNGITVCMLDGALRQSFRNGVVSSGGFVRVTDLKVELVGWS